MSKEVLLPKLSYSSGCYVFLIFYERNFLSFFFLNFLIKGWTMKCGLVNFKFIDVHEGLGKYWVIIISRTFYNFTPLRDHSN